MFDPFRQSMICISPSREIVHLIVTIKGKRNKQTNENLRCEQLKLILISNYLRVYRLPLITSGHIAQQIQLLIQPGID